MSTGSLTIVGTGIQFVGDVTLAAKAWIEQADKVLFATADPVTGEWLRTLNASAEPLFYDHDKQRYQRRREMYREMVARILTEVRQGLRVCAVFYGHPGVFVDASHEAIRQAGREGFKARMLPGISAQACLFADLGIDPGRNGCQSFDATDFLIRSRQFDPHSSLILWQIALIGYLGFDQEEVNQVGIQILTERLQKHYGPNHEVILYEAAIYAVSKPVIQPVHLHQLPQTTFSERATLYVPPKGPAPINADMMARLGLSSLLPETRKGEN